MRMTIPEPLRCAIYTTEHNLDLAFNSRDASEKRVKPLSRARPLRAETCCRSTLTMVGCLAPRSRGRACSFWLPES
jgi:hypothetical protein